MVTIFAFICVLVIMFVLGYAVGLKQTASRSVDSSLVVEDR